MVFNVSQNPNIKAIQITQTPSNISFTDSCSLLSHSSTTSSRSILETGKWVIMCVSEDGERELLAVVLSHSLLSYFHSLHSSVQPLPLPQIQRGGWWRRREWRTSEMERVYVLSLLFLLPKCPFIIPALASGINGGTEGRKKEEKRNEDRHYIGCETRRRANHQDSSIQCLS